MPEGRVKTYLDEIGGKIEPDDGSADVRFSERNVLGAVSGGDHVCYELFKSTKKGLWAKSVKRC